MPRMIGCLLFRAEEFFFFPNQVESVDVRGPGRIREERDGKEKWLDSVAGIDVFATWS